nr:hypothetical protein [Aquihabitans sp. G128]
MRLDAGASFMGRGGGLGGLLAALLHGPEPPDGADEHGGQRQPRPEVGQQAGEEEAGAPGERRHRRELGGGRLVAEQGVERGDQGCAVGEGVVELEDEGLAAVGQAVDEHDLPGGVAQVEEVGQRADH